MNLFVSILLSLFFATTASAQTLVLIGAPWKGRVQAPQQFLANGTSETSFRVVCSELYGPCMVASSKSDFPFGIRLDPGGWLEQPIATGLWVSGPKDGGYAEVGVAVVPRRVASFHPGDWLNGAQTWKPRDRLKLTKDVWVPCGGPSTGAFRVLYTVVGSRVWLGNFLAPSPSGDPNADLSDPLYHAYPLDPGQHLPLDGNSSLFCRATSDDTWLYGMKLERGRNWSWPQ